MWSGPRNVSTALMRSWGSRPDTYVCDEPFYAHYLAETGLEHPGRDEVIAAQETDWRKVAAFLAGPVPEGRAIFYQKQMSHHLLPGIGRDWLDAVTHAFLIREPEQMLPSLARVLPDPALADTGLPQQCEIFERVADRLSRAPPVLLASDLLKDPERMLRRLCEALSVPFLPQMLRWEPGPRPTDGVWARHWYKSVEASTGFAPWREPTASFPGALRALLDDCRPWYEKLHRERLRP